ncbi:MAG: arginine--tRNA ligase [Acidobacteriota bacterium]|nr:arginine--tRNA ligase [Blastocatellia bacterium]MDW8240768.1 arginine--tRNA ligase [Acidobacteriota bacterium]
MASIETTIKQRILAIIQEKYHIACDDMPVETPPSPQLGDIALPIAFELAKQLSKSTGQKQNPRKIAEAIAADLTGIDGIARVEIAGPGYINIFLDRPSYLRQLMQPWQQPLPAGDKIIVEHTSVNPNKAAHVGHLRNALLGDTIVRLLRATGRRVEVHNYIDNTGVQVADVVVGFLYLEKKSLDDIQQITGKFDDYCWDLYARVTQWYEQDAHNLDYRRRTLKEMEIEGHPTALMADYISTRILNCHLDTFDRLGIRYDLLPRESDILHLHFWELAFEILKQTGTIVYETTGRNAGCWVMKAEDKHQTSDFKTQLSDTSPQTSEETEDLPAREQPTYDPDKVLVRSDGTVNYTGKDIAYHLWKLGKLGVDFNYKPFRTYPDKHETWITTTEVTQQTRQTRPMFGFGAAYLNVIGVEQTYPQKYVKEALARVAPELDLSRSAHVAYEKVALSPQACLELGIELQPDELRRQQINMSGRRGLGVKVDDLIDKLEERALAEVRARQPDAPVDQQRDVAHQIAIGALRYFLLKYTRTTAITFDFQEALSFEGETGPYIQYAVVRANSIFRKAEAAGLRREPIDSVPEESLRQILNGEDGTELWSLIYQAGRLDRVIDQACDSLEPAFVAKHAFTLAQRFNVFYHNYPILREPDQSRRTLLLAITEIVERQLRRALAVLGIEAPERM